MPEFCVVKSNYGYSCLFEDGVRIRFDIPNIRSNELINSLCKDIYEAYLVQTNEYGINSK